MQHRRVAAVIVVGHVADNKRADQAGQHAEFGIRLALHELTKSGALADTFGNKKSQVNHTITEGEIDSFESQAVRLQSVNRAVALLGGTSPKEVLALDHVKAPILSFQGQPVVGASSNVFYLGLSASRQGETLGKTIAENEKIRQIVFVQDERRTDAAALIDAFQKAMGTRKVKGLLDLRDRAIGGPFGRSDMGACGAAAAGNRFVGESGRLQRLAA